MKMGFWFSGASRPEPKVRAASPRRAPTPLALALEPRYMFDGAAAVTAADAAHQAGAAAGQPAAAAPDALAAALAAHAPPTPDPLAADPAPAAHAAPDAAAKALIPEAPAPTQLRAADPSQDGGKKEVAFVDTADPGYQALADGVRAGVEVELIDGGQSGLAQIATWAETHSGYDAIHVISHGTEAALRIGTDTVTSATLDSAVGQAEMAALGSALKAGGDLLLYGCDVAKGTDGQQLVAGIAAATGADVAASDNRTGAAAMGGDWVFETRTGAIETAGALTEAAEAAYDRVLAPAHDPASADQLALIPDVTAPTMVQAADPSLDGGKREVVFIDTSVADYQTLVNGIRPGVEIELIDGGQDGLAQMAKWAESHSGYDAIHVLSHGAEGTLILGTNTLTGGNLSDPVAQAELAEIGSALNAGGDLLVYGCDIANGTDGQQFVADLATGTGADVAASTNDTGAAALGGDWYLEISTGSVDRPVVLISDTMLT